MSPSAIRRRQGFKCKHKVKLTFEEASSRIGTYPKGLEIYMCPKCEFLHFGHKPGTGCRSKQ